MLTIYTRVQARFCRGKPCCSNMEPTRRPSIKYFTQFFANFDPPAFVTLCHTSRDPPKVRLTSRTPPMFSRPSTENPDKSPLYKFSLNCSRGFLSGGFCQGVFCLE